MAVEQLVGPAPPGWEYTTLSAACKKWGGKIQTGPFGSQLHASDYVPIGIPSIMPQNIGDNRIIEEGIARISSADAERLSRYLVRPGDIVYSRRGDVERRALVREQEDGWLCGTGCLRVRLGNDGVDPHYAFYYFGHPDVREWVVRHAHGATMPNLNTSILGACPILVPPLPEQRAIAHILGTLDDKIELNRRMSETLEAMARVLFKSWFVHFDPVRAKDEGLDSSLPTEIADLFPDRFVDSELGEIPEGWGTPTLAEVLTESAERVGDLSVPEYSSTNNGLQPRSDRFKKKLAASSAKNKLIRVGWLVFGLSRRVLNFGLMRSDVGSVSSVYKVFVVDNDQIVPDFLEDLMRLQPNYFYNAVSASSREGQSVSSESLSALKFSRPPMRLQRLFYKTIGPLSARLTTTNAETSALLDLRDSLLPKLISGELRLNNVERFGDPVVS